MGITYELQRLGNSARRLNAGSDSLNESIERIDALLGKLNVGLEYVHPRPLAENSIVDDSGKRVIELMYVGYLKVDRRYHLAVRTTKVLESRLQLATQSPGKVTALLHSPRQLRFAAVDILPELVAGLAAQVDEMVAAMTRRQETADSLLRNLESIAEAEQSSGGWVGPLEVPPDADPGAGSSAKMAVAAASEPGGAAAPKTEYYPGSDNTQKTPIVAVETGRKTVPIGSGALRRMQRDPS